MKIARAYTGRPGLITFGGGFHGRTFMTMALTGKVAPYKIGFGPFPGSVYHGVYPNAAHGVTTADALKSLERIFKADIAPDRGSGHHSRADPGGKAALTSRRPILCRRCATCAIPTAFC